MTTTANERYKWLAMIILIAAVIAAYWDVGSHKFILTDDGEYVYRNPHIRNGLSWDGIKWAFSAMYASNWHPVTWISHMFDIEFFGMNAGRHHQVNLLFHLINTILLFAVFYRVTYKLWSCAFLAGLFALHPMHVESVAWVAERKDVLSTFFMLAALWMYISFSKKPQVWRYLICITLYALGLMSKPMLVTFPVLLLLFDYWPLGTLSNETAGFPIRPGNKLYRSLIMQKLPFFIMAIISSVITVIAQSRSIQTLESISLSARIVSAVAALGWYIWKLIYPVDLSILYLYPMSPPYWEAAASIIFLAVVTLFVFKYGSRHRYLFFGWFWYLVSLIPVIGILQVGSQSRANRYTYIPYIGLFIIVIWIIGGIQKRYPKLVIAGRSIGIIALVFLGILTHRETGFWRDDISLYGWSLEVTPNNHLLKINLGIALASAGHYDAAEKQFHGALELAPESALALNALGTLSAHKSEYEKSLEWHLKALAADPDEPNYHYRVAITLLSLGRAMEALPYITQVVRIRPDWPEAHMQLGIARAQTGDYEGAIAELRMALELEPELWRANVELADIYVKKSMWNDAIRQYQRCLEIRNDYDCLNNLGSAQVQAGNLIEAERTYRQAIAAFPQSVSAYNNLAVVLVKQNRKDEAVVLLKKVLEIEPDNAVAARYLNMLEGGR